MEWRRLFLSRRHSLSSSGAQASAAVVAGEISALLTAGRMRDSVNRAEQFIRSNAVGASGVPEMYHSLAAAGPRGQRLYLSVAASALVQASARADLPDGALLLLDLLIRTPTAPRPSAISFGHLMVKLLSLGRHADARRVFEILADRHRNRAINEVWRAGRAADAVKVFGETAGTATARKHSRYRYLTMNTMNDYLKKGDLEAASELRTQMVLAGMELPKKQQQMLRMLENFRECPYKIPRNVIIEICIMADGVDEAIRWLQHTGHDGMAPPRSQSYNMVLASLWKAGRGDDAVKMFEEMAGMSLAPNHFTYTIMINGHLKRLSNVLASKKNESGGDLEAALQLRAQMVQDGFKPDEQTYNLLMAELCLAERLGDVTALFHEMLVQGTTLHKIVHGCLFTFLFRISEDQLLGIIEKSAKDGVSAVDNGCVTLLEELCRIQKVSLAEKVMQTFVEAGLVPTTAVYNILIDGYCKTNELQGAFLLCRQMELHDQLVPNEATYEAMLVAVRNNTSIIYWEDVVELFEKNGVSTDALNSGSSATYGFKYRSSLIPRMFNQLSPGVNTEQHPRPRLHEARTPRAAILARLVVGRSSERPSTLDPPVGLPKGGTPEANAGRAAPGHQASSPSTKAPCSPSPLFLINFFSCSCSCCLAHQAAGSNNPLRIPPSQFPKAEAKARTFLSPLVDRFSTPGGLRAELTPPIPLPDSLGAARRRRPAFQAFRVYRRGLLCLKKSWYLGHYLNC